MLGLVQGLSLSDDFIVFEANSQNFSHTHFFLNINKKCMPVAKSQISTHPHYSLP